MERFDVEGARQAAAAGRLLDWLVASLRRRPGENRSLAAILRGQNPVLEGPLLLPLAGFIQGAGPGEGFKWPKDPETWESEVAAISTFARDATGPLLVRETAGARHLSDGNHRLDAWRRQGETHGWAVVWRDRDPRFAGWWGPFPPEETPRIEAVEPSRVTDFLPQVEDDGTILAAVVGERIVGAVRLVPEFGALTLRTMRVDPAWRGRRLGARILHHARPLMDGRIVYGLAYPWLTRFYGEFGFAPIEPERLPEGLRARYEGFQDARDCVALRREAG